MEFKHIKTEDVKKQDFGSIDVQNFFPDDSYDKFSIAKVEIKGKQEFGLDKKSDVAYYVLKGKGKFFIEDKEIIVNEGDLIFIPKNTKYKDEGHLTLLAISVPKFDREKRVRIH